MKILVIGGSGHIGRRIVATLSGEISAESDWTVVVGGRYPDQYKTGLHVDLEDSSTFDGLADFDVIVNCTDTYRFSPRNLFERCLREGTIYVEMTADTDTYVDLYEFYESKLSLASLPGTAILGVGVFPGLSNLLGGEAARSIEDCQQLDMFLSWNVISGAGAGTCEVMVQSLARPIRYVLDGKVAETTPIGLPHPTPCFAKAKWGFQLGLPEPFLFLKSLNLANSKLIVATRPSMPRWLIGFVHRLTKFGLFRPRWIQVLLRYAFRIVRVGVLSKRSTPLEMVAVASSATQEQSKSLHCDDAFQAAADLTLAMISILGRRRPTPGVYTMDQLFRVDEIQAEFERRGNTNVQFGQCDSSR